MIWERSDEAFHATVETPSGEVRVHLIVEKISDELWDWAVWKPGEPAELAWHGTAATVQAAMQGAELAAR